MEPTAAKKSQQQPKRFKKEPKVAKMAKKMFKTIKV